MLSTYATFKTDLSVFTGMTEDLIHVHVGLAIFVVTALLLRRRMRSPIPLAVVAVMALANEIADYYSPGWDLVPSLLDFVNTIFWPLVLFLLARRGRGQETVR